MSDEREITPHGLPLVTVGLTCFNAEATIERALTHARAQAWENLEMVVVDDGSSDRSVATLERWARDDARVRLVRHAANRGTAAARNTILREARGEFIAFFDDDDASAPDRIGEQWRRIESYERAHGTDLVACYTNRAVHVDGSDAVAGNYYAIGRRGPEPQGNPVADYLLWHYESADRAWGHVGSCTLMFRRALIAKVGEFDERFRRAAEWDWAIRLAFLGGHFIAVDRPLVTQYITPTPDKSGNLPLTYALELRAKHAAYLKRGGVYSASRAIAHARFHYLRGHRGRSAAFLVLACLLSPHRVLPNELAKRRRMHP